VPLVEPGELEVFLILAEELHFGRAAQRHGVTSQRVSQLIQAFERRIGGRLFDRTSRRVELTALGRQLHAELQPHYTGLERAIAQASATARGLVGTLRVGAIGALWMRLFVEAAERVRADTPGVEIIIREVSLGEAFRPVLRGEIDVMNGSLPIAEPDLTTSPALYEEPRVLAISIRHRFALRPGIEMRDLAQVQLLTTPSMPDYYVRDRTPEHTPDGSPIGRGPDAYSLPEALALIAAGKGAYPFGAQMIQYYQRPGIAYVPIIDAPPLRWGLTWPAGTGTRLLDAFIRAIHPPVTVQP
jgi:DNA-binding transcriptional LysR family regulator